MHSAVLEGLNCFFYCQRVCTSSAKPWRRIAGTAKAWFLRRRSLRSSLVSGRTHSECSLNGKFCLSHLVGECQECLILLSWSDLPAGGASQLHTSSVCSGASSIELASTCLVTLCSQVCLISVILPQAEAKHSRCSFPTALAAVSVC